MRTGWRRQRGRIRPIIVRASEGPAHVPDDGPYAVSGGGWKQDSEVHIQPVSIMIPDSETILQNWLETLTTFSRKTASKAPEPCKVQASL